MWQKVENAGSSRYPYHVWANALFSSWVEFFAKSTAPPLHVSARACEAKYQFLQSKIHTQRLSQCGNRLSSLLYPFYWSLKQLGLSPLMFLLVCPNVSKRRWAKTNLWQEHIRFLHQMSWWCASGFVISFLFPSVTHTNLLPTACCIFVGQFDIIPDEYYGFYI